MTRRLPATPNAYKRAFDILRSGGLVALPTETVYGLAASAKDDKAVKKLYDVKERSSDKPPLINRLRFALIVYKPRKNMPRSLAWD